MKSLLNGFKDFISRGNAIDLAVGVIIGTAFAGIVASLQAGLLGPLIALIFGQPDISDVATFTINNTVFSIGLILNAILQFLITAITIYFFIVLPLNKLAERRKKGLEEEPKAPAEDILLLQQIRDLLAGQQSAALRNDTGPSLPPTTPRD
ncbi:large conductance mechanosensitive channel protein MscL [Cellulomonas sp. NPDC055163]